MLKIIILCCILGGCSTCSPDIGYGGGLSQQELVNITKYQVGINCKI